MLPEIGELFFSVVVGYMGVLEFLYVVRHLFHWSFQHNPEMRDLKTEAESLKKLQDQLKNAINQAKEREKSGLNAMQDGVPYKDGFRVNKDQKEIEELKEQIRIQEKIVERKKEIEAELERQRKIEADTKKKLKEAEEELRKVEEAKARERQKEIEREQKKKADEEENKRKIIEEEKRKEEENRRLKEEEENKRKLFEAEKEREEKQRLQEIEDEKIVQKLLKEEREREEEEQVRKLFEAEKEREKAERLLELEEEENRKKLIEAERKQEENRLRELEEENNRKLIEAEREKENIQRQRELEEEENNRKLIEAERKQEEIHRQRELEDEYKRKIVEEEEEEQRRQEQRQLEDETENQDLIAERENTERLLKAEEEAELKQRQIEENEEKFRNLLQVERELEQKKQEMEEEADNLRKLIEAEKMAEERQRKIDEEALQKLKTAQEETELKQTLGNEKEAIEDDFIKKDVDYSQQSVPPTQTVKTQYGQTGSDSLKPKSLLFPSVSEESSSAEPASSLRSSFSTQQSSEAVPPELHFDEYERQAPDGGEDMPSLQYSDEYLRSLDGIKNKPLVREDGSGRRRAFKKRRSSGSSTSSRESRASREEELKMFTSLEEEEFENIRKGDSEYDTIKYTSEPNLKVTKQHRRHKRSPAKDVKRDASDAAKGSLEMLDEEDSNPWGEVKPEHYKNTEFWKRETNLSIDEERDEADAKQTVQSPTVGNIPKMSSFEEATKSQHEEVISALQSQRSKEAEPIKELQEPKEESDTQNVSTIDLARQSSSGSNSSFASASAFASASNSLALTSPDSKRENSFEGKDEKRTSSPSSGLRRSPRVDEMKEYEEHWKAEDRKARAGENPIIEIDYASDDEVYPTQDELLMEGISDFYDFNASINPSRSRSRSRSKSKTPADSRSVSPHQRRLPSPQNVSHDPPATTKSRSPSPDPASYKFIYQRIIPSLATETHPIDGLSDFYDFHSKLNQYCTTETLARRSNEVHRTSVDYLMEDLSNSKTNDQIGGTIAKQLAMLRKSPSTPDYERTISAEWKDVEKLKEELLSGNFKRSTYVGESMDFSDQFESLREEAKHFRRSRSKSRSPVYDVDEMAARTAAKKKLQEKILEDILTNSENTKEFSSDITKSLVDRNRRASDTALIQKPEILFQIQDLIEESEENFMSQDFEADEYHHFRRFSLNQEIPIEEYPDNYEYVSEIEIKSLVDLRPWTEKKDIFSVQEEEHNKKLAAEENPSAESNNQQSKEDVIEEAYESGSDDERQTVVEVDDEIDEDIWDYNERPEESHNEQSECEEADREIDRYAGRRADDWQSVEGAVGGVPDDDSFQIDQIYDDAIKNRKPSGILREFDNIIQEIQISDEDRVDVEKYLENDSKNLKSSSVLDPGLWSPRSRSSRASSRESSRSFLEYEKSDNERRYLADATMEAINSTRLRSRYGIVPSTSLPTGFDEDITDIDINYVPKKEYNWRKNFKLDDEVTYESQENPSQTLNSRKFSLGGDSITLFSRSPEIIEEREEVIRIEEENREDEIEQEPSELEKTSKKKKIKRKSRKSSKGNIAEYDEEMYPSQKESIATEGDVLNNNLKSSLNDDLTTKNKEVENELEDSALKKKSKKRRKAKEEITLPKLDIILPQTEKKPPKPSVAAIRAALSAPSSGEKGETLTGSKEKSLKSNATYPREILSPVLQNKFTSISSEKKTPPPSVASVRAALTSERPEEKPVSAQVKPKKLWETGSPKEVLSDKKSSVVESLPISPIVYDTSSPQSPSAKEASTISNGEQERLRSKSPQPLNKPSEKSYSTSTTQNTTSKTNEPQNASDLKLDSNIEEKTNQNQIKNQQKPEAETYDIIKDGGLYPLF